MSSVYAMFGVDKSVTRIIFGEGTHSNNLLKLLNIENTYHLIFYGCHLIELDWKKQFGHAWPSLSPCISELLRAKTEVTWHRIELSKTNSKAYSVLHSLRISCQKHAHSRLLDQELSISS